MILDEKKYRYMMQQRGNAMRAYVKMMAFQSRIQNIARCIAAGGVPSEDPDVKDDYYYLVSAYGADITLETANRIALQMKDEKNG